MYQLNDTIAAVSSVTSDWRVIIRINGSRAVEVTRQFFVGKLSTRTGQIYSGSILIDPDLEVPAWIYLFAEGHSYTGEALVEIHFRGNQPMTEQLMSKVLGSGTRMAGPGEFTARAYLNGKLDLAQAEAVNEIIASSNDFQLQAAEKLLSGRLCDTVADIRSQIIDCLSLVEMGMDFSLEDIEFITPAQAQKRLRPLIEQLDNLLTGSISYESVTDLPSVGIAGAPNAGKSSLSNALLGRPRSIVSEERKTTRDVLTGTVDIEHSRCVIFDCAGLLGEPESLIDRLAEDFAVQALTNASLVVFCVDLTKEDWGEDLRIRRLIDSSAIIPVATRADLVGSEQLAQRVEKLSELFASDFIPVSVKNFRGLETLRRAIDNELISLYGANQQTAGAEKSAAAAVTARHRNAVGEALKNLKEAVQEIRNRNDEVAAMLLRGAYEALGNIETGHVDEKILDRIFGQFCIGK